MDAPMQRELKQMEPILRAKVEIFKDPSCYILEKIKINVWLL
jgi:hypothetical protein